LTAASALARQAADDGPHLIYLPERVFDVEKFKHDVRATMAKYGPLCDRRFRRDFRQGRQSDLDSGEKTRTAISSYPAAAAG